MSHLLISFLPLSYYQSSDYGLDVFADRPVEPSPRAPKVGAHQLADSMVGFVGHPRMNECNCVANGSCDPGDLLIVYFGFI